MTKPGLLMIGCATIFTIPSCMADSPTDAADPSQVTEAERVATPELAITTGVFGHIQLANTQLCLQPLGGSIDNVPVELRDCTSAQEQNWLFSSTSKGYSIINQRSGKCLYNGAPLPLFDGGKPVTQEDCLLSGTGNTVSNALWKPISSAGNTALMSRVQFRDTGFCVDVPGGFAFAGVQFQMWHCNGTAAQQWIVN